MKKILKFTAVLSLLIFSVLMIAACSLDDPYKKINNEGYTVSVKYDIGNGKFSDRDLVLVDAFNLNNEKTNADGKKEITLIPPDSDLRKGEKLEMTNSGYTFVGWYKNRTEVTNPDGSTGYTYSGMWDFSRDKLILDPNGKYSPETPTMTLYAAWVPLTQFEIYCKDANGSFKLETVVEATSLELPQWVKSTGKLSTTNFPSFKGKTFDAAYLDENCTVPAPTEILSDINYETGTLHTNTIKVYTTLLDGSWYKIHSAKSMASINDPDAHYIICSDLDFSEVAWSKTKFADKFNGTISTDGEKYKLSNINATYIPDSKLKTYGGIFKEIGESAVIENVTFDNVSFTFDAAINGVKTDTLFIGLLAGNLADGAVVRNIDFIGENIIRVDDSKIIVSESNTVEINVYPLVGNGTVDDTIATDSITIIEGSDK